MITMNYAKGQISDQFDRESGETNFDEKLS